VNLEVLYSAAHAEFPDTEPLGGGKAVADYLIREWQACTTTASRDACATGGFALTVLSPKSLGMFDGTHGSALTERGSSRGRFTTSGYKSLANLSELAYAGFCREFERAATAEILKRDPQECVVLSNDISEGPDFGALGARGYRIVTIFHVDVVEYFTRFYLRGLVRPETVARFHWFGAMPDMLRLVFEKQYQCVRYSARIVVPSAPMNEMILRCYPWCPEERIVVLPWGNITDYSPHPDPLPASRGEGTPFTSPLPSSRGEDQGEGLAVADDEIVIITLSRLSPEKGIERLLAALPYVDARGKKLCVFICGGAAYMKGRAYERKLRRLAEKVSTSRVEFTGHVVGAEKAALLRRADIFVSPSRHESYGLTIAEALAAGCPVISHSHYGAVGEVVDCANTKALGRALSALIAKGRTQKVETTKSEPSHVAEQLAEVLTDLPPRNDGHVQKAH
jgi:glycosyltransferase involved in cell wall biosynthesis